MVVMDANQNAKFTAVNRLYGSEPKLAHQTPVRRWRLAAPPNVPKDRGANTETMTIAIGFKVFRQRSRVIFRPFSCYDDRVRFSVLISQA